MTEVTLLPFDLAAVQRKKLTVDFEGGSQSSDGGLLLLREAERSLGICARFANSLTDRRDPGRVHHQLVELIKTRALAICCGYEDGNDLDRLEGDPLPKLAVGRCPESGADLCSQSTMSRLENMPNRREAVQMTAALIDQFCTSFWCRRSRSRSTSMTRSRSCHQLPGAHRVLPDRGGLCVGRADHSARRSCGRRLTWRCARVARCPRRRNRALQCWTLRGAP